jgi:hypothetical protein
MYPILLVAISLTIPAVLKQITNVQGDTAVTFETRDNG